MQNSLWRLVLLLALNFFAFGRAYALLPETGWWWNPSESGRGFNIEIQDNGLYFSTFIYNADGSQQWYTAYGVINSAGYFSGPLTTFRNGQCIECGYKSPQLQPSPGNISIQFTSESTGTLSWLGKSTAIRRFAFTPQQPGTNKFLLGEWAIVEGSKSYPSYWGERITFKGTQVINGTEVAVGNRSGHSGSSRMALGSIDDGDYYILLDTSPSYYTAYAFTAGGLNSGTGKSWSFLKTSSLSGSGLTAIAFRMSGATAAAGGNAPVLTTQSLLEVEKEMEIQNTETESILKSRALAEHQSVDSAVELSETEISRINNLVGVMRALK